MTSVLTCRIMLKDASHRAKIFVIMILAFVISWYPLFLLIIIDVNFKVGSSLVSCVLSLIHPISQLVSQSVSYVIAYLLPS